MSLRERIARIVGSHRKSYLPNTRCADEILAAVAEAVEGMPLLTDKAIIGAVARISPEAKVFMQNGEFVEDFAEVAKAERANIVNELRREW